MQVTDRSQSETTAALTLTEGQPGAVNMRYNNCVSRRSRGRPVYGDGNRKNRLQLREKLDALKPQFAFASSTTRGPGWKSRFSAGETTVDWALKLWSREYTDDQLMYSCSGEDGAWSSVNEQLAYNRTNNVTRYHIQKGSSWPTRFSLMNCW